MSITKETSKRVGELSVKIKSCLLNNGIYIRAYGHSDNPCIILIHGLGSQLIHWPSLLIEGLVSEGFYIITFDNRDAGLSRHYDELGTLDLMEVINLKKEGIEVKSPYTLEDMASDVVALMDSLSIKKANILGVSMGGMIAQSFALHNQDRVLKLILVETTSGDFHLPQAKPEVLQLCFLPTAKAQTNETVEVYVDNKIKLYRLYNPHFFNEEKTRALLTEAFERSHDPDGFKRQLLAIIAAEPRGERLKTLSSESLIIHGEDDPAFPPEHGKYIAECIPNSQLEVIEKMGHGLHDEVCGRIVNLISEFIGEESSITSGYTSVGM